MPSPTATLTVALLTYNRAGSFLPDAIAGILQQTFQDFEFLILDNGSTDSTADLVLGLDDPRIRYVRNPVGSSIQFNGVSAFQLPRGERVIATHDDDIMEPTMLAEQMALMDAHPDVKLVWTNVRRIDVAGRELEEDSIFSGTERIFPPGGFIEAFLAERLWPMPSGLMFDRALTPPHYFTHYYRTNNSARKEMLRKASRQEIAGVGDIDLPARINIEHSIGFIDRPLLRCRIHANQDTRTTNLTRPSIHLYENLRFQARKVTERRIDDSLIEAHIIKYQLQDLLFANQAKALTDEKWEEVTKLYRRAFGSRKHSPEALAVALPVHLAARIDAGSQPMPRYRRKVRFPADFRPAVQAYHKWAEAAESEVSIFASLPAKSRLVIFGTVLVAALLIRDALRHDYDVVACIDSNLARQGDQLFGVSIHPPNWLVDHSDDYDYLVLTSEDFEVAQEQFIKGIAGEKINTISWKSLANAVTPVSGVLEIDSRTIRSA